MDNNSFTYCNTIIDNTMLEWSTNTTSQDKRPVPDPDQGFGEEDNKNDLDHTNGNI